MKKLVIAIDFDGTIVTDKYPDIGYLKRNAKKVINELYDAGMRLSLIHADRARKSRI